MISPLRSVSRLALTAAAVTGLALTAAPASAQSLIRDTEIEEILARDSEPILKAAGIDPKNVEIVLVGSKELNAFAGPRVMGFNTGLILESDDPNELQGVIAHEVGHLAAGHSARSGDMQSAGMKPFLLTMGLGVLAAIAGAPEAAAGLAGSASYFGTLGAMGYSREQESRADQAGATLLDRAGLSGKGLADFFDNFRYQEVFDEARRYAYFRSHPISSDRIEGLRRKVETQPNYNKKDSPEAMAEHAVMKAKLDGFLNPRGRDHQVRRKGHRLSVALRPRHRLLPAQGARQGAQADRRPAAGPAEQPLSLGVEGPDPVRVRPHGRSRTAAAQVRGTEARRAAAARESGPDADRAGRQEKVAEGVVELKRAITQEEDNAVAWRILAEAYDKLNEDGLARLATAEYNFNIGDKRQARVFAMRAREMLTRGTPEWRRATDIVLVAEPTREGLRDLAREGSIAGNTR